MFYAKNFLDMDKIDRLLDAIEHPEHYSSVEIEALLQDSEVKEAFDLLDKTKSSLQSISAPDVEGEWKRFVANHSDDKSSHRFKFRSMFTRKVAASIAIGIISLTAVVAIVGIGIHYLDRMDPDPIISMVETDANEGISPTDSIMILEETAPASTETVIFDNETFETMISEIAEYYGYEVIYETDKSKPLRLYFRWNQALPIEDIVESLNNFEQIHLTIENKTIKID